MLNSFESSFKAEKVDFKNHERIFSVNNQFILNSHPTRSSYYMAPKKL